MSEPEAGRAIIYNRPFGPVCLIGCPNGRGTCNAEVRPTPGDGPRWDNHGTDERPTLTPSYNCVGGCGWHGYIVDGELSAAPAGMSSIQVCSSCKHPSLIRVAVGRDARGALGVQLDVTEFAARTQT